MQKNTEINFRSVEGSDRENLLKWRNSSAVRPYMYNDAIIEKKDHNVWFDKMLDDRSNQYWVVECCDNPVGVVCLNNIDSKNKSCEWAFYIFDENMKGKGIGSAIENYVIWYVFEKLELEKLNCEVLDSNLFVIKMHEKFGFEKEGYFRSMIERDNKRLGVYRLSMLREDYLFKKSNPQQSLHRDAMLYLLKDERIDSRLEKDLKILDQIQQVRSENNVNWMDILRLGFKHAPSETRKLVNKVGKSDIRISSLLSKLVENEE